MSSLCHVSLALLLGCGATAPAQRTTVSVPATPPRPGVIESVAEIKERSASNAASDALVAIFVGSVLFSALLFQDGPRIIVGADDGGAPVVGADGETTTLPRYQVDVRFDDGRSMTLVYINDVPFHRGERVVLTQQGLVRARG